VSIVGGENPVHASDIWRDQLKIFKRWSAKVHWCGGGTGVRPSRICDSQQIGLQRRKKKKKN
jgi:hypothetical protein